METCCAKHIEANVKTKFGSKCSSHVFKIAKTYSSRQQEFFLDLVREIKPAAAEYIEAIEGNWKNTSWLLDDRGILPSRYGILTSNTSECVNSMFLKARQSIWLEWMSEIVDILTTRIGEKRAKYLGKSPDALVPKVYDVLKKMYESSVSIKIIYIDEFTEESNANVEDNSEKHKTFKATDTFIPENSVTRNNASSSFDPLVPVVNQRSSVHIVRPTLKWCSCGFWQDIGIPCRHGLATLRETQHITLCDVMKHHVSPFYTIGYCQKLYDNNFLPVILDNLPHDRVTKPPIITQRQPGRPKVKRYRRRSECIDPDTSKITCSLCHKRGHNCRTCTEPN